MNLSHGRISFLENSSHRLNQWMEGALFAMGISMAMVVAAQVFFRYVLNHFLFWAEELARYLLVWLSFCGATVAYHREAHPGVDLLVHRLPPVLKQAAGFLVHLTCLAFFGIMVVYGIRFAFFVRLQVTPALTLPKWVIMAVVPFSGAVFIVHCLGLLVRDFQGMKS